MYFIKGYRVLWINNEKKKAFVGDWWLTEHDENFAALNLLQNWLKCEIKSRKPEFQLHRCTLVYRLYDSVIHCSDNFWLSFRSHCGAVDGSTLEASQWQWVLFYCFVFYKNILHWLRKNNRIIFHKKTRLALFPNYPTVSAESVISSRSIFSWQII